MNDRIRKFIGFFFDDLPYSAEAAEARDKIEKELAAAGSKASPDELAEKYGSYEKLALLGGYTEKDAANWRSEEVLRDETSLKKEIRQQRRRSWLIALLAAGFIFELLWTVYNAFAKNEQFFFTVGSISNSV